MKIFVIPTDEPNVSIFRLKDGETDLSFPVVSDDTGIMFSEEQRDLVLKCLQSASPAMNSFFDLDFWNIKRDNEQ